MLKESIQDRRHSKVKWGPAYVRGKSGGQKVDRVSQRKNSQTGVGKCRCLRCECIRKTKATTLVLDQVKTWHISIFPLDMNAVRTGLLAETSDLCYSGEREGTSSRLGPQSEFKDSQDNLMKPPSQKGKKTAEWEQGSAGGNLLVCEPPGSVSTITINQSSVRNQNCTQKRLQWLYILPCVDTQKMSRVHKQEKVAIRAQRIQRLPKVHA